MRKGFTMIELIFVIVILGILAAVAIPKLTATRDDAQIARLASDAATAVQDIGSYYTARGRFGTVREMTNVQLTDSSGSYDGTTDLSNANTVYLVDGANNNCLSFQTTNAGISDGNLTVAAVSSAGVCDDVNTSTQNIQKTYQFGGTGISF